MILPPGLPTSSRRDTLIATAVIFAVTAIAYANSFAVPFVFDDNSSIRDNPSIRSLATAFFPPAEHGLTVSGRPLLNLSLALNYAISGTEVWSYHLVNLLIHALNGCLLFALGRRMLVQPLLAPRFGGESWWLALAAAGLWTLHPLQTESVTYVVQRAESLVALFYLLTLLCFVRATATGFPATSGNRWLAASVGCALLGMAAKEVMATAPLMVALYDRVFVAGSWREVWRRRRAYYGVLAATWLLLGALVAGTGNRGGTAGLGTAISSLDYALTQISAVAHYLRLAVWPHPLVFDYGRPLVTSFRELLGPALVLLPLLSAGIVLGWRGRPLGYALMFFFVVLAPSSSVVPVVTQTMNEHRAYLPLAGLVMIFVAAAYRVMGSASRSLFVVLALALGVTTVRRNHDYRTELALWEDTVAKRPQNDRAWAALGAIHQRDNRLADALAALQEAARINPALAEHHNNLGNVWMKLGRWNEAAQCFERALTLKPDDAYQLNNLGNARLEQGRVREALAQLEAAVRVKPDLHEARYNLANILAQNGRLADALPHYEALLRARPDDVEAHANYGNVLLGLGRTSEGIAALEQALRLRADDPQILNNLGVACAQTGRLREAVNYFEAAVRAKPDFAEARANAARAAEALRSR